jgi:hypothetical protein
VPPGPSIVSRIIVRPASLNPIAVRGAIAFPEAPAPDSLSGTAAPPRTSCASVPSANWSWSSIAGLTA